ncbi:hypothetical protein CYMTET_13721 [Cymbomonas tetramitiformis]|uniref:Uncharacterized protein n=1 Tax=Cymbomonas tetramitiformis TaxID=36881 RepID=A0AAE0GI17_9CHLO|nr:hypothetical protein CYMTET_13721 [Cymbomonas tetramitiformis]
MRSPDQFQDNWFGIVFKLYFPVKVLDGREVLGRCYWAFGPEELVKVYGLGNVNELFTGGRRAVYPSFFEFDFALDEICNVSVLYPTFLDVRGLHDLHFVTFFDHTKKTLHPLDFTSKLVPCLLCLRASLLRTNSCAGRKFFETLEAAVTQFCARKKLAKRPHAPAVQVYCTRENLLCALSDDMLQQASLVDGVIEVVFPSAAAVESTMDTFTEVYSGKRETFSFVIVWPCKIIFRPQLDGDRVHFVMTGIIKEKRFWMELAASALLKGSPARDPFIVVIEGVHYVKCDAITTTSTCPIPGAYDLLQPGASGVPLIRYTGPQHKDKWYPHGVEMVLIRLADGVRCFYGDEYGLASDYPKGCDHEVNEPNHVLLLGSKGWCAPRTWTKVKLLALQKRPSDLMQVPSSHLTQYGLPGFRPLKTCPAICQLVLWIDDAELSWKNSMGCCDGVDSVAALNFIDIEHDSDLTIFMTSGTEGSGLMTCKIRTGLVSGVGVATVIVVELQTGVAIVHQNILQYRLEVGKEGLLY